MGNTLRNLSLTVFLHMASKMANVRRRPDLLSPAAGFHDEYGPCSHVDLVVAYVYYLEGQHNTPLIIV